MNFAPLARIVLRYAIGYLAGSEIGETLAMDDDLVMALALGMGAAVEALYARAKIKGGAV